MSTNGPDMALRVRSLDSSATLACYQFAQNLGIKWFYQMMVESGFLGPASIVI